MTKIAIALLDPDEEPCSKEAAAWWADQFTHLFEDEIVERYDNPRLKGRACCILSEPCPASYPENETDCDKCWYQGTDDCLEY